MLDCLVLKGQVAGQLVLIAWLVAQPYDYPGPIQSSAASPKKEPEQPAELRIVRHLDLLFFRASSVFRMVPNLEEIWTNG